MVIDTIDGITDELKTRKNNAQKKINECRDKIQNIHEDIKYFEGERDLAEYLLSIVVKES